jgi:hypothetical protein
MGKTFAMAQAGLLIALLACPAYAASTHHLTSSKSTNHAGSVDKSVNWSTENAYWRDNYTTRPYYKEGDKYETYQPAYHYGVEAYRKNHGKKYEDVKESSLRSGWGHFKHNSKMAWEDAKEATHDAYDRLFRRHSEGRSDHSER